MRYSVYVDEPREKRVTIAVRITPAAVAVVDQWAEAEDRSRSDMVRRMLTYAARHMPKGWKP